MPKVKRLKAKKKKYEITFQIEASDDFVCDISEDLVVEYRLVKDKELSPELYKKFLIDLELDTFIQKAKRYVIGKYRSQKETRKYLEALNLTYDQQNKIIAKLEKLHLIDDREAIDKLVGNFFFDKHYGMKKIEYDLRNKGFSTELIFARLSMISTNEVAENLNYLFEKKLPSLRASSLKKAELEMKQYLYAKGYDFAEINEILAIRKQDFSKLINEEEQIKKDYSLIEKKYARLGFSGDEKKYKILQALQRKGYTYGLISQTLERGK